MSYSFSITASSKDDAIGKVDAEFDKVVDSQPTHRADRDIAQDALEHILQVLINPSDNENVYVSCSGSISWREENAFTGVSVNVSASVRAKT
jgi:hypothetical protein